MASQTHVSSGALIGASPIALRIDGAELCRLALKSWTVFVEKEGGSEAARGCGEDDPRLLAALDEAIAQADATPGEGHSAQQVRARLSEWTSK
jgi:hypothetical protein